MKPLSSKQARAGIALCLCAVFALAGCAFKNPSAEVVGARIKNFDAQKLRTEFTVRVKNPNSVGLTVKRLDYTFDAHGKNLVSDSMDKVVEIPKKGSASFKLPVSVKIDRLISAGIETLSEGKLPYKLKARITASTPVGDVTVPVSKSGVLDVPGLLKLLRGGDGQGTGFEIPFDAGELNVDLAPLTTIR